MEAACTTTKDESKVADTYDSSIMLSPVARVGELRDKQRSLRDSFPMDHSSSNLSLASLGGDIDEGDPEKLSRSLSRIRIRRPSASFNVDMSGMVNEGRLEEQKTNSETVSVSERSQKSQSSTPSSLTLRNMFGKANGKTVLAVHPSEDSKEEVESNPLSLKNMLSKPKGKTVLAKQNTDTNESPLLLDMSGETDDMSVLSEITLGTKQGELSSSNPLSLKSMLSKSAGKTMLAKQPPSIEEDGTEKTLPEDSPIKSEKIKISLF